MFQFKPPVALNQTDDKSFYSIIAPETIRPNRKYNVAVSLHKSEEPCEIKITLKGPSYEDSKTIELQPMSTENIEFDIPRIYEGDYELISEGIRGIEFKKTESLNFDEYGPLVFIQTDKATYKPGDLVQFRVLFLDDRTRPMKLEKAVGISISDGEQNRLKQWKNIEVKNGVYVGKYQLSEQPVLGQWYIEVNSDGLTLQSKSFEVDKYVLPKFDVTIETAKDICIGDGIINATIRSKYTYGKPVKGKATVSLKPLYLFCGVAEGTKPSAEKTINVDGKGEVQFKINEDFKLPFNSMQRTSMQLTAIMEEELTGNKQETSATVQLHMERYRFEGVDMPYEFFAGKPLTLKVAVKNVDDTPVLDSKNALKLVIERQPSIFRCGNFAAPTLPESIKNETLVELSSNLDEHGIATFEHIFPEACDSYYGLSCEFKECKSQFGSLRKHEKTDAKEEVIEELQLTVINKKPKLGEKLEIQLKCNESIPYFVYTIVGREKLLRNELITIDENTKEYVISIEPTFDMVPTAAILVHYVVGKDLKFEETTINFEREFENFINITAPSEAQLGEDLSIEVNSNSDSYVGLLGVDQSVLLLRAGNDISKDDVFNGLHRYDSVQPWRRRHGRSLGAVSGLTVMTNANYVKNNDYFPICYMASQPMAFGSAMPAAQLMSRSANMGKICADSAVPEPVIQIRKEFPENWIFEDIECLKDNKITIQKTVPDTITSWVITGFSLNPETGFAVTKNPSKIKTFRPFFISTNLPYSLKRGEQISIPVLIFNYMDQDLDADVTLENTDDEYEFIEAGDDETKRSKQITVSSNSGGTVNFIIRPKTIGQITLKITAVSPLAGDAIHKKLKVEPEGITVFKNRDYYLHSEEGLDAYNTVKLDIPDDVVLDSELIEVSVMGNILGSTISNIDKLVRMPYGCGEQNMVNFVPNILVLWYLESIQELSTAIEEKAKRFLEIGYQRELTYKHDNGSYSAFGKSDSSGSTWLTAYVMRSFHQAKKYIDIDPKILEEGLDFLAKTQAPNGCFPEVGRVLDFSHMSALGLTAFVLLAFLENTEYTEKHKEIIERGFLYLQQNVRDTEDLYSLSVAVYALQKRQLDVVHEILAKLEALARIDGGLKWWTKEAADKSNEERWHTSSSNDVEITGYILMTILEMNVSVLPITKWLISQRNSNGGFQSTQETVVGLWALIKFAEKSGAADPSMIIEVTTNDNESVSKAFDINKENSMAVQSWELSKATREVTFNGKGTGTAIIQISYRYNILEKEAKPSFKLTTKIQPKVIPGRMCMDVYAEFVPTGEGKLNTSNMVVMEISSPSGYTFPQSFDKIKEVSSVKRVETKDDDTRLIIYFDNLKESEGKCIPIEAELSHAVEGQKPVPIVIYDYYDNKKRATDFYQIENSSNEVEN